MCLTFFNDNTMSEINFRFLGALLRMEALDTGPVRPYGKDGAASSIYLVFSFNL